MRWTTQARERWRRERKQKKKKCSGGKEVHRRRERGEECREGTAAGCTWQKQLLHSTAGFEFERALSEPRPLSLPLRPLLIRRQVALTSGSSENRTEKTQKTIISKRSGWARIISKGKEEEPQSIANGCETDNELKEPWRQTWVARGNPVQQSVANGYKLDKRCSLVPESEYPLDPLSHLSNGTCRGNRTNEPDDASSMRRVSWPKRTGPIGCVFVPHASLEM